MNATVLLSGGLDSQVLLASVRPKYASVHCIGFRYGQRHVKELQHAKRIALSYHATFEEYNLPSLGQSSLTGKGSVPKKVHYADPRQSATVVPNRNAVMLSIAASLSLNRQSSVVFFAAHAGDAAVYPDCRPSFVEAINTTLTLSCGVSVMAPFLGMNKRQIVDLGRQLGVQFKDSWSCYQGEDSPCGECGACIERAEALR